jgi:glycosyltransferase involved in cell wall biosynthesis
MTVSIIIPTYNRADTFEITLSSIYRQLDLEGVEVIVIDNGSTDNTANVCGMLAKEYLPALKYQFNAEPGLLTGRHSGASLATGEILCFIDDDVELSRTWITGVKDAFGDDEVQLATGPCLPKYQSPPPEWLNFFWESMGSEGRLCTWLSLLDLGNNKKLDIHPNYVWGLNFCIRKTALYKLEGFHPDNIPDHLQMFQGDGETGLTLKANKLNYKAIYHPQIMLHHIIPSKRLTVEYFKKRAFYQGVCNSFTYLKERYQNNRKHSTITTHITMLRRILQEAKNKLKSMFFTPPEIILIKKELRKKELEGYHFHQQAFKNNEKVKEWVLQKNYWDYKLPT